jgi:hypothetical protein
MRFILALVAAATVQAIPEVTAVQQENTCSNWPSGLFGLTGDSTGTTIDGAKGFFQVINDPPLADGYVRDKNLT